MAAALACAAALAGACATMAERPPAPQPPPSPAVVQAMGYEDVVQAGTQWATARGYQVAAAEATQLWPNYWRLRFGLQPSGSGRMLQVEFDGQRREWLKEEVVDGVAVKAVPR